MGIKDLSKLIADVVPEAIKENEIKNYFGRKVAIDASMSLYQFLIAVRQDGAQLTDANGEPTSHLNGTFYRVIYIYICIPFTKMSNINFIHKLTFSSI